VDESESKELNRQDAKVAKSKKRGRKYLEERAGNNFLFY
jgi:hypothetical protein